MTQITIPNVPTQVKYSVTSASTGPFIVPFAFFDEDDVKAAVVDALGDISIKLNTSDFTFTTLDVPAGQEGNGYEGGEITLTSSIGADGASFIVIYRDTAVDRTFNYPTTGPFSMPVLNDELNERTAIMQEVGGVVNRALVYPRDPALGTDVDGQTRKIANVLDPTEAQDVATLSWVNTIIADTIGSGLPTGGILTSEAFTGDGTTIAYVLSVTPPTVNALFITLDGVLQRPTADYTLTADTVTFTSAPPASTAIVVRNFGFSLAIPTVTEENIQYARTPGEISAGVLPVALQYYPGNVLRYGPNTTPGTTDMADPFQDALDSGNRVWVPIGGPYNIGSTLTIPPGTTFECESRDVVIIYSGTTATYFMEGTLATWADGITITDFTLECATTGAHGFKFIECRHVHMSRFNIKDDDAHTTKFAIGILFDDDVSSSPQVGSAWNYVDNYILWNCTDAGIRLDTQGTLTWCNRNYIGFGHAETCGIGLDIVRGATNFCRLNPQNCTTGYQLGADADYNSIIAYEETSTASITIASGAVWNIVMGSFATGTIVDSGLGTTWLTAQRTYLPEWSSGVLNFDPVAGGNVNISVAQGQTGSMNFNVRDDVDAFAQVVSLVANVPDPYAVGPNFRSSEHVGVPAYTTTQLPDIGHAVNTSDNKKDGTMVWNTTTNKPVFAAAATAGASWYDATGSVVHNPA
jgi:hypothetical protein